MSATTPSCFSLDYLAFASQRSYPVDTDTETPAGLSSGEEDEIVAHASILLNFGKMEEWSMEEEEEEDLPMEYHPRKKRQKTTPEQLLILEEAFQTDKLPSPCVRSKLARHLGMSPRRVQIWFQNKRAKEKKTSPRGKHQWVIVPSPPLPSLPSPPIAGSISPSAGVVSPMEGLTNSMANIMGNDLKKPTALYPGGVVPFEFTSPTGYSFLASTESAFVPIPFRYAFEDEEKTQIPRAKSPEHQELTRVLQSRIAHRISSLIENRY